MIFASSKLHIVDPPAIHGLGAFWSEPIRNLSDEPGRHADDDVRGEPLA